MTAPESAAGTVSHGIGGVSSALRRRTVVALAAVVGFVAATSGRRWRRALAAWSRRPPAARGELVADPGAGRFHAATCPRAPRPAAVFVASALVAADLGLAACPVCGTDPERGR